MQRVLILTILGLGALGGLLWLSGVLEGLTAGLADAQRVVQDRLAESVRSLRGGEVGAMTAFSLLCFAYGVLHAAGPGHGKLVIGGYGLAQQVPLGRLAGIALAASLAQTAVAVLLVYALVAVLGLARGAVEGAAQDWLAPFGHAMIAGLGLWLVWRGLQGLRAVAGAHDGRDAVHANRHVHDHPGHHHEAGHDPVHCATCGHAHGPTLEEVSQVTGLRSALLLIGGIALRPCSGALLVLILTWQLGIAVAGLIGVIVMGLGTALVTVATAVLAVSARQGALFALPTGSLARVVPLIELAIGGVIAVAAVTLLLGAV